MENRIKQAQDLVKNLGNIEKNLNLEKLIKDNKVEFKLKEKDKVIVYRIRKLTFKEQEEVNTMRMKKYNEMLNTMDDKENPVYEFRKDWIEKLKKRKIDVESMENEIRDLSRKIEDVLYKLAQTKDEKSINTLKEEVNDLRKKQATLSMQITDYLHYSIEDQLNTYVNFYNTYLALERKEKDNWVKVFKSYNEFENCDNENLINQAIYFSNVLIYGTIL